MKFRTILFSFLTITLLTSQTLQAKIYTVIDKKTGKKKEVSVKNVLDIVVLLEESEKGGSLEEKKAKKERIGSITNDLVNAIKNEEAIIVSAPLVRTLIFLASEKYEPAKKALDSLVSENWSIYQTKDAHFGLFVNNKTYKDSFKKNGNFKSNSFLDLEGIGLIDSKTALELIRKLICNFRPLVKGVILTPVKIKIKTRSQYEAYTRFTVV
jgi:hypothetical protein